MYKPIEDYSLLSDCRGSALVARDGSIDWMCLPRFDSGAFFSALLGEKENGTWSLRPKSSFECTRKYRKDSLVLQTYFSTANGKVCMEDALIVGTPYPCLVRSLLGLEGEVEMETEILLRMDYGSIIPWLRKTSYGIRAVAGPEEIHIQSPVRLTDQRDLKSKGRITLKKGDQANFVLSWTPSHRSEFIYQENPRQLIEQTDSFWKNFAARCQYDGPYRDDVIRSLLTLKGLTYEPTGGIIAAPTTSLPEEIGGERNWDYRYCWIRDSTYTLYAFLSAGYKEEAGKWNDWLLRAVAGTPNQAHIMYGIAGERRLPELELPWLRGYQNSLPVRIGNAAHNQHQLDVFGETLDTLHLALKNGFLLNDNSWRIQRCFVEFIENHWHLPDEGIWEMRGPRRHYTHSKVMAWVAVDRAIRNCRLAGIPAPFERWESLRKKIHDDICRNGFCKRKNSFVQSYDSEELDASLLMIPVVGFLPIDDPRVKGTVGAIEKELTDEGFVKRYHPNIHREGVPGREGAFLPCSFWLVDCLIMMNRKEEATQLFDKILSIRNDVGLLSEEYDFNRKRLVGNFPQALSHIALVITAFNLSKIHGPAADRSELEDH